MIPQKYAVLWRHGTNHVSTSHQYYPALAPTAFPHHTHITIPPMTLLEHLPDELWVAILSSLPTRHLASPCLVSRRMCNIAQPILFKGPSAGWRRLLPILPPSFPPDHPHCGGRDSRPSCPSTFINWENQGLTRDDPDGPLFSAAFIHLGVEDQVKTEDVQVILLLHVLPQLHVLDLLLPDDPDQFCDFMDTLDALQPVVNLPLGLQSLRHFSWESYPPEILVSPKTILTLLNLPNIRSLDIPLLSDGIFRARETVIAAGRTSSIQQLIFYPARTPTGIRQLEITRDNCWTLDQAVQEVVVLLQQKDVVVPRLEAVSVRLPYGECMGLWEQLMAAGEVTGVQVLRRLVLAY